VSEPHDLAQWSLHCFCLGAKETPHRVVRDNGVLLHRLIGGAPSAEVDEEQLALLERYGLVRRDGELIRTSFPTLGTMASRLLRQRARSEAVTVVREIADRVREVNQDLAAAGFAGHAHAVVFGHVLDGLTWGAVRTIVALPDTRLCAERPLWNGAFWATYPKPQRAGGTNELRGRHAVLVMVWEDHNLGALRRIAAAAEVGTALDRLDSDASELVLAGMRLPVLGPATPTPLANACHDIATTVARRLVGQPGLATELERVGAGLSAVELPVVFGHEFIWAVRDQLLEVGALTPPSDDLAQAMFVHRHGA
jgi:hypothetical protein